VNNTLKTILLFIFLTNCSLHDGTKFWTNEKIKQEPQEQETEKKAEEIFAKEEALNLEFNPNLKISLYSKAINKSFLNNYDNNNGRINYNGDLKSISRFKFSKIDNFHQYNPIISFENNNIIFFDNKGSIFKFDQDSNLIWEKNYYSKSEKKQKPVLLFANNTKILVVADNISKYYALDINTGELLWSKDNIAPFNSQIKIYNDKFFVIDLNNILRSYSIKNGDEIWNIKTEDTLIRSQKKLSIVIVNKKIYFNNSLGDVSAVDITSGELLWQSPTQNSLVYDEGFLLQNSDIIADKNTLYFSNNKNQFFSIDISTGILNWQQKINSNLRPTLIDNYIFTVSLEGYLIIIEKKSGNIIRSTDIFKNFKSKKRSKIKPVGFIVGLNNIYLTTDNGRLLVIDITTGVTTSVIKVDNDKISRPFVLDKNLYIIKDSSIIKLN
jgi:outer membrane protein assembly factor BamB